MNPSPDSEDALFEAALKYATPQARTAYLDQACAGRPQLRRRIEALLTAHDAAGGFLENPPPAGPAGTVRIALPPEEKPGEKIGHYKIREKIGEGGCGVVYVAEQEQPVRRRVALKVIKLGMDTKSVIARFEAERQALAMMDHPNIAKVLDAGTTETGRPYFVMELVRGIRITDYCDQNHLDIRQRLELFILVCHAVQHAHQKGIIHRDIKPSNILVTLHDGVPVPKVIDFGIAKATEGRLTDMTVYTELHQFIGTPAYMSPEQAEMSGLDIDTRSDIYSLGVLLYELLTGKTPFDAKELIESGLDAMRHTIREKEPLRPSTRLSTMLDADLTDVAKRHGAEPPKLVHLIRGDLDWIVMKSLEKDRTRRYETANGLAMDIRRHLNNETVVARPPSSAYRFQKLVRRNKLAFAAAGAITAVLVIGLAVSIFLYIKENQAYKRAVAAQREADRARENESQQRQQADAARAQAEGLVTFMMQDLQPALTRYGRLPLMKQVVEKAIQYFDGLPPDLRDLKTEFGRADTTEAYAEILRASGYLPAARIEFEKALTLYQRIAEQNPGDAEAPAAALLIEQKLNLFHPQPSSERDAFQLDILRRWHELYRRYPDIPLVSRGLIGMLLTRSVMASYQFNKPQEAVATGLEAETMLQNLAARNPDDRNVRIDLARAKTALATAYDALGEQEKSVHLSEESVAFFDRALKEDSGDLTLLADAANAEKFLSYRISPVSQKRAREAELVARDRYRTLAELDPSNAEWRYNFAMTHMMECYYLEAEGQLESARQALRKFDSLLEPVGTRPFDREKLVDNSSELARLAAMAGDSADARAQTATGQSRFQAHYELLPAGSYDRIQARIRWLNQESRVFFALHDWAGLEQTARETLAAIGDGLDQRPGDSELLLRRAVAQGFLGIARLRQGNAREAIPVLQQSAAGYHDTPTAVAFAEDRESFAVMTTETLAEALATTGDNQQARGLFESALAVHESKLARQPESWELKEALANSLVLFAGALNPSNAPEAARLQSLLDRAANILNSPEAQNRLTVDDKEVKAKIQSLRATPARPAKE
jgi:serine/threonine protein kinase/tetratricopeptide (TPR) repeat protein